MDMPDALVDCWQVAYSAYSAAGDPAAMARSSADVASVWREMAAVPGLAWWLVAALSAGAEAFEHQARDFGAGVPRGRAGRPGQPGDRLAGSHRLGEVAEAGERFRPSVSGSVA